MTSRERMNAAMSLSPPDRVPVMAQFSIGHMLLQLGVPPAEFWNDAGVYVDGLFRMREIYDFDGILVSLHGHDPAWRSNIKERRQTPGGEELTWADGSRTLYPPDDLPRHTPAPNESVDVRAEEPDDIPAYIPVSQGLRFSIHAAHTFDAILETVRRSGGRFSVHGEVTSPFDYLLDRCGHEAALVRLLEDPAAVRRDLALWSGRVSRLARRMCATGVDAIKISSPFAGAGFISPGDYRDFILPAERDVIRSIRERGAKAYLHTCGAIADRLELMIASGADGIECLDPPPLGNIELGEAIGLIGGRCFVKGNVDSVNCLLRGSPDEIRADVRARLEAGRASPGFILSTACSIAPGVKREHVMMMSEAVQGTRAGGR